MAAGIEQRAVRSAATLHCDNTGQESAADSLLAKKMIEVKTVNVDTAEETNFLLDLSDC